MSDLILRAAEHSPAAQDRLADLLTAASAVISGVLVLLVVATV